MAHVRAQAEYEGWTADRLTQALCDVKNGMDQAIETDETFRELGYGVVVGDNPAAASKIAGFPEFGDVVLYRTFEADHCTSFGRIARGSGNVTEYTIGNRDGTRRIKAKRHERLAIVNHNDIIGIPDGMRFSEINERLGHNAE